MFEFLDRYPSGVECLTNDLLIVSLYAIADVVIGLSLAAVVLRLWHFLGREYMLFAHQVRLLLCLFFSMTVGYALDLSVLFAGAYHLEVLSRGVTAGVAVVLAFSFWDSRGRSA